MNFWIELRTRLERLLKPKRHPSLVTIENFRHHKFGNGLYILFVGSWFCKLTRSSWERPCRFQTWLLRSSDYVFLVLHHSANTLQVRTSSPRSQSKKKMKTEMRHLLIVPLLLLLICVAWAATALDYDACMDCVHHGCSYCVGDDFVGNKYVCRCGTYTCQDGSYHETWAYDSKWDCKYDRADGETKLTVMIVAPILVALLVGCCIIGCCVMYRRKQRALKSSARPTESFAHAVEVTESANDDSTTPVYDKSGVAAEPTEATGSSDVIPIAHATQVPPPAMNPNYGRIRLEVDVPISPAPDLPERVLT